jgi:hypothetical protein
VQKLQAYQIDPDDFLAIRAALRERPWMDETIERFAYRCLPMTMANQYGWEILCGCDIRATWDGAAHPDGLRIEQSDRQRIRCNSHFGAGILTFQIPFLFQTSKDWNLMVRGPANHCKDGIAALDAIVETDWTHATFTMNWKFTRACTVEFSSGEPICLFFPIRRGMLETFKTEIRDLDSEPDLKRRYDQWSESRGRFITDLKQGDAEATKRKWEKQYTLLAKEKKHQTPPFTRRDSR